MKPAKTSSRSASPAKRSTTSPASPRFSTNGFADGRTLDVIATGPNGERKLLHAMVRIDTPQEIEYYKHGGILQYVLRQLAAR